MKKRNVLISVLAFLTLLAVGAFLLFQQPALEPQEEEQQTTQEVENPIKDEIPDVNPTANTNPFGDTYKNPFE